MLHPRRGGDPKFAQLVGQIRSINDQLATQASKAVNLGLTLRNWLIGWHIQEFELCGEDRSRYGERLFDSLAERLDAAGVVDTLSYSHFELLAAIDDPLKRAVYEVESIRGTWSVRELKRQIASLYYERSGLSRDKKKLARMVDGHVEHSTTALTIRDPYVFEFLGVRSDEVMPESRLEHALLDRLEAFLLELGRGSCFEARQRQEELPAPADSARQITKTQISPTKPTKPHARPQVKRD